MGLWAIFVSKLKNKYYKVYAFAFTRMILSLESTTKIIKPLGIIVGKDEAIHGSLPVCTTNYSSTHPQKYQNDVNLWATSLWHWYSIKPYNFQ